MLKLNVKNETARLRAVVLGSAVNNGPTINARRETGDMRRRS